MNFSLIFFPSKAIHLLNKYILSDYSVPYTFQFMFNLPLPPFTIIYITYKNYNILKYS